MTSHTNAFLFHGVAQKSAHWLQNPHTKVCIQCLPIHIERITRATVKFYSTCVCILLLFSNRGFYLDVSIICIFFFTFTFGFLSLGISVSFEVFRIHLRTISIFLSLYPIYFPYRAFFFWCHPNMHIKNKWMPPHVLYYIITYVWWVHSWRFFLF